MSEQLPTHSEEELPPIIPNGGTKRMGRIRPGTRLLVRAATDEEIAHQRERVESLNTERFRIDPDDVVCRWLVCLDDPEKVLHDWFTPVGGVTEEAAYQEAEKYARRRGAEVVR